MIFGDTAKAALFDEYARAARNVDVAVTADPGGRLPLSTVDAMRAPKALSVGLLAGTVWSTARFK